MMQEKNAAATKRTENKTEDMRKMLSECLKTELKNLNLISSHKVVMSELGSASKALAEIRSEIKTLKMTVTLLATATTNPAAKRVAAVSPSRNS